MTPGMIDRAMGGDPDICQGCGVELPEDEALEEFWQRGKRRLACSRCVTRYEDEQEAAAEFEREQRREDER